MTLIVYSCLIFYTISHMISTLRHHHQQITTMETPDRWLLQCLFLQMLTQTLYRMLLLNSDTKYFNLVSNQNRRKESPANLEPTI